MESEIKGIINLSFDGNAPVINTAHSLSLAVSSGPSAELGVVMHGYALNENGRTPSHRKPL